MRDEIAVRDIDVGKRLDVLLKDHFPDFSRTYFQKLIAEGLVYVNGDPAKKRTLLEIGDEIEIEFILTPEINIKAEPIPLDILYEDEDLLIVNKPAGLVVHPAPGHWTGTFASALLHHVQTLSDSDSLRPGIVHRLDKDTTGVLMAAKHEKSHRLLVQLFSDRLIEKEYLAVTIGNPGHKVITGRIGRHPVHRKAMTVVEEGGREAETVVETINYDERFGFVRLFPKTGRTHQLRVHLKSIGTPILGDPLYGVDSINRKFKIERPLLHAHRIAFTHPISGDRIEISAPLPDDIKSFTNSFSASSAV